ncbi:cardiolipin synthase [Sulfitobacter sp. SK012]|uniref:cardiolipin synthase n=1 Tax=Sulfitobacter sp. SK012 TaxID=1389005 RepID=UPI000E0C8079|nr:cardiolipin synthase [Sulfitobacter sp. SK012]AXI47664.1 cardiolipin synthase [Sulfitobacter sp. SK012]
MLWLISHVVIATACIIRILLRPHRQPESRLSWLVVVLALPYVGVTAYLLLGETNIGRKRVARLGKILNNLPRPEDTAGWSVPLDASEALGKWAPLFKMGESISGYQPVGGNVARLMENSDAAIDEMAADIDAASDHVHLMFYIWLTDSNGMKIVEALKRAASRGVTCRAMADDLGSRDMVHSPQWREMKAAGVHVASALRIGNPLLRAFDGRIDLRDHRKILVIDNRITYCGSQNCADPAFLPKKKFAPWVDAVMRFEGPVVRQNQHLFASDWMANTDEDIRYILRQPMDEPGPGFTAQVIGTGPTVRSSAMPEMFETLMYAARDQLFITTPYYVPNSPMEAALCAAANRGVNTTIIFPERNDDFAVGATSKSYYEELLTSGVKIFEYQRGILHTKSITLDGEITLIGSANMDRRSFDLNYENNILLYDPAMTEDMRARQSQYLEDSRRVTLEEVQGWSWRKRILNNALAILGPVL